MWDIFRTVAASSNRGDAMFHLLLAGCLVGGTIFAGSVGTSLWQSNNQGVRFSLGGTVVWNWLELLCCLFVTPDIMGLQFPIVIASIRLCIVASICNKRAGQLIYPKWHRHHSHWLFPWTTVNYAPLPFAQFLWSSHRACYYGMPPPPSGPIVPAALLCKNVQNTICHKHVFVI